MYLSYESTFFIVNLTPQAKLAHPAFVQGYKIYYNSHNRPEKSALPFLTLWKDNFNLRYNIPSKVVCPTAMLSRQQQPKWVDVHTKRFNPKEMIQAHIQIK